MNSSPRITRTTRQPVLETPSDPNIWIPATMHTAPTTKPIVPAESMSNLKTVRAKIAHTVPVTRKYHQWRPASAARSLRSSCPPLGVMRLVRGPDASIKASFVVGPILDPVTAA
jgi:hypothetical protein